MPKVRLIIEVEYDRALIDFHKDSLSFGEYFEQSIQRHLNQINVFGTYDLKVVDADEIPEEEPRDLFNYRSKTVR